MVFCLQAWKGLGITTRRYTAHAGDGNAEQTQAFQSRHAIGHAYMRMMLANFAA